MSARVLLCSLALTVNIAPLAEAQNRSAPDFTSANFGWLLNDNDFDWMPVQGMTAPPGGPDPKWRGGIGLPRNDFNYQPREAASDPGRDGPSRIGPWNIERMSDAANPNLKPWAADVMRMHNDLVSKGQRAFSAMSRCWPGGPSQLLFAAEPLYFVQTPGGLDSLAARSSRTPHLYEPRT